MYLGNVMLLILNLPLVGLFVQILPSRTHPRPADPAVLPGRRLQHLGAVADVLIMVCFGVLAT